MDKNNWIPLKTEVSCLRTALARIVPWQKQAQTELLQATTKLSILLEKVIHNIEEEQRD